MTKTTLILSIALAFLSGAVFATVLLTTFVAGPEVDYKIPVPSMSSE